MKVLASRTVVVASTLAALSTQWLPLEAHAQTPRATSAKPAPKKTLREQLPAEAQGAWDTAVSLYLHEQWDGARTSFYGAYDISKNPRVLFNVAVCEKNLGRYARAIEFFRRELSEAGATLSFEERAEILAQIEGLERFVAQVTVDVSEPGADIFIDESKVGTSPLAGPVSVQLGERHIRAAKAGFTDAREDIELKGGSSGHVSLRLMPLVKTSVVDVTVLGPSSAVIKVDGKDVGASPYRGHVTVSPEPHAFSAEAPGFVTASQSIVIREGESPRVTLQMDPEQRQGRLSIRTTPDDAAIEIDGRLVGSSRWEGPVNAGVHQVTVKKRGYYTWTYDVDIAKGGARTLSATLNEDRNTNFVPWLIGSIIVAGAGTAAVYFIARPKDEERVNGTLPPFQVGTTALRF